MYQMMKNNEGFNNAHWEPVSGSVESTYVDLSMLVTFGEYDLPPGGMDNPRKSNYTFIIMATPGTDDDSTQAYADFTQMCKDASIWAYDQPEIDTNCCDVAGDANNDGACNVGDAVYLINLIFRPALCVTDPPIGCPPPCMAEGDANVDGSVNVGDAVYLINLIFRPAMCATNPPIGCPPGCEPPSSGSLVAWYTFDEGSDITAHDASGHGNHGTLMNGPTWTTGIHGGALLFDGNNDYVNVPDAPSLDINGPGITFMAWINSPNLIQAGWVIGKGQGYQGYWVLPGAYGGSVSYGITAGGDNTERSVAVDLPIDTWLHFCVVYDGSFMRFYLDGVARDSGQKTGDIDPTDYPLYIGKDGIVSSKYFRGKIDEVKIFDCALTPAEINSEMLGR